MDGLVQRSSAGSKIRRGTRKLPGPADFKIGAWPRLGWLASTGQDQADGRFFTRLPFMFVQPLQVQLHLALVRGLEAAEFEFDGHGATQPAVEEQQVEVEVFPVDDHAFLPFDERKAAPQLQDEGFELAQEGGFQVGFVMALVHAQEVRK